MLPKRPRLKTFDYIGLYRYFLTFCADRRRPLFTEAQIVILREDENTTAVIAYIMNNPIRAGLAKCVGEYRFAGSATMSSQGIIELLRDDDNPPWQP